MIGSKGSAVPLAMMPNQYKSDLAAMPTVNAYRSLVAGAAPSLDIDAKPIKTPPRPKAPALILD